MSVNQEAKKLLDEGIALYKAGSPGDAIQRFLKLVSLYPDSDLADNAHYNMGQIYLRREDYEGAFAEFQTILDVYPDSDAAHFAKDMVQEIAHQVDPSAKVFEAAQQAYIGRQLDRAVELYQKLLRENPKSSLADNAHLALAMIGKVRKDRKMVEAHLEALRRDYPDSDAAQLLAELGLPELS